ncbi:hypothetical protein Fcan01_22263 [Folsomia candida]|uniref:Uncharacterized protein n=1 Tax=Folsomia candida TaxID=158441 RepID=A0A226DCQ4_FOLCA|nr:hypothetical protein Fcan01_22263 [Folsomia candida]
MAGGSEQQRDWSLGLSDDENDTDAEANKIIGNGDELNDELTDLLKDIENTTEFGPSLLPNVSSGFAKTAARPLTKESKATLAAKIKVPENCKEFLVPKVNSEIWRLLPSQAKILDINQQQIQQSLTLGLSSLAVITNTIVNSKESIPKEVLSLVVKQAMDGANILGDQFQAISSRRRFEMKRHLNPEYGGICSQQFPSSEWLFGTDLAESLKSTKATSTLMRSTMNRGGRYHPYSQPRPTYQSQNQPRPSLNWGRPQQAQFRGSGQNQPRFSQRPQGHRFFSQNNQYNRFQKY